jgi:hypothetical protein
MACDRSSYVGLVSPGERDRRTLDIDQELGTQRLEEGITDIRVRHIDLDEPPVDHACRNAVDLDLGPSFEPLSQRLGEFKPDQGHWRAAGMLNTRCPCAPLRKRRRPTHPRQWRRDDGD